MKLCEHISETNTNYYIIKYPSAKMYQSSNNIFTAGIVLHTIENV